MKTQTIRAKIKKMYSKFIAWFLVSVFVAISGYFGYMVIELKADKRIAEQKVQVDILEGQLEILQATIVRLSLEGSAIQEDKEISFGKKIKEVEGALIARITAYACPTSEDIHTWTEVEIEMNCPSWNGLHGTTATGAIPTPGVTIACDASWSGKTIEIEGLGTRVCQDTGGAIDNEGQIKIDEFVDTKDEANHKGVRYLKVNPI